MKTIEQRAQEYCEKNIPNLPDMHFAIATAYEEGATEERRQLTEWHKLSEVKEPKEDRACLFRIPNPHQDERDYLYVVGYWRRDGFFLPPYMSLHKSQVEWREIHE